MINLPAIVQHKRRALPYLDPEARQELSKTIKLFETQRGIAENRGNTTLPSPLLSGLSSPGSPANNPSPEFNVASESSPRISSESERKEVDSVRNLDKRVLHSPSQQTRFRAVERACSLEESEEPLTSEERRSYVMTSTLNQLQTLRKANRAKVKNVISMIGQELEADKVTELLHPYKDAVSKLKENASQCGRTDAELAMEMKTLRMKKKLSEYKQSYATLLSRNAELKDSIAALQKVPTFLTYRPKDSCRFSSASSKNPSGAGRAAESVTSANHSNIRPPFKRKSRDISSVAPFMI
jgi:hypothetical protein